MQLALDTCQQNQTIPSENEKYYVLEALKTLYHLAYFDRPRYYIPGETATQSRNRQRFAVWGGLIALININCNSTLQESKEFCKAKRMSDIETKDLDLAAYIIQLYLEKKENGGKKTGEKQDVIKNAQPEVVLADKFTSQNAMFVRYGLIEQINKNDIIFPEYFYFLDFLIENLKN